MTRLMSHPRLRHLFSARDFAQVDGIAERLTHEALAAMRAKGKAIYDPDFWLPLAQAGLFRLGMDAQSPPDSTGVARSIAMTADVLSGDVLGEIDLAVYVQGIAVAQTLMHCRNSANAQQALARVQAGEWIACTLYTDQDPAKPCTATRTAGGYRLQGRKWLSVNLMHADIAIVTFLSDGRAISALLPLDAAGITRISQARIHGSGLFSQGIACFDGVEIPQADVLATGLQRLRIWNRVMSISRLQNAIAVLHEVEHLMHVMRASLTDRPVVDGAMHHQPAYRRWFADASGLTSLGHHAVAAVIAQIAEGHCDESGIAGLKAHIAEDGNRLGQIACHLCGGASTLDTSEVARVAGSLNGHRYSSGASAPLMALYAASIGRRWPMHQVLSA